MMFEPKTPAPNRDLANVPPYVASNSQQMSPMSRKILGSLSVAIGTGVLLNVLLRAILELDHAASGELIVSDSMAVMAAICFFISGILIFSRGVTWTSLLVVLGLVLAIAAKWIG